MEPIGQLGMIASGGGKPKGELNELVTRDFGSFEKMQKELKEAAVSSSEAVAHGWFARTANSLSHRRPMPTTRYRTVFGHCWQSMYRNMLIILIIKIAGLSMSMPSSRSS